MRPILITLLALAMARLAPAKDAPATLAPLGDSRTAIIAFDKAGLNHTTLCHFNWANALNQQKYPCTGVFGISGATSDTIISTMLDPALASAPRFLVILMGVNDVRSPGFSADHTMANIAKAADMALARGITPIVCTDPGSEHYLPAHVAFINELNSRIADYCTRTKGAVLFDLAALASTQRAPSIILQPGWFYDGIHLQTLGAYKVGVALASLLDGLGASIPDYPGLAGNILGNPGFIGTAGKLGDGNTGVLPDLFTGGRDNANCSSAFAVNARPDGANELVVDLRTTAQNGLGGMRVSQVIPVAEKAEGFQAGVQVEIDSGSVNLADVRAEVTLVFSDGTFAVAYDFDGTQKRDTISAIDPGGPLVLTLQSPANLVGEGREVKSVKFVLGARVLGQGNAVLRFRNPWCRKVPASPAAN